MTEACKRGKLVSLLRKNELRLTRFSLNRFLGRFCLSIFLSLSISISLPLSHFSLFLFLRSTIFLIVESCLFLFLGSYTVISIFSSLSTNLQFLLHSLIYWPPNHTTLALSRHYSQHTTSDWSTCDFKCDYQSWTDHSYLHSGWEWGAET